MEKEVLPKNLSIGKKEEKLGFLNISDNSSKENMSVDLNLNMSYNVDVSNLSEKKSEAVNENFHKEEIKKLNRDNHIFQSKKAIEIKNQLDISVIQYQEDYINKMINLDRKSEKSQHFDNVSDIGLDHSYMVNKNINNKMKKLSLHPNASSGVNLLKKNSTLMEKKIKKITQPKNLNADHIPFKEEVPRKIVERRERIKSFKPPKNIDFTQTLELGPKLKGKTNNMLTPDLSYINSKKMARTFMFEKSDDAIKKKKGNIFNDSGIREDDSMDENNPILDNLGNNVTSNAQEENTINDSFINNKPIIHINKESLQNTNSEKNDDLSEEEDFNIYENFSSKNSSKKFSKKDFEEKTNMNDDDNILEWNIKIMNNNPNSEKENQIYNIHINKELPPDSQNNSEIKIDTENHNIIKEKKEKNNSSNNSNSKNKIFNNKEDFLNDFNSFKNHSIASSQKIKNYANDVISFNSFKNKNSVVKERNEIITESNQIMMKQDSFNFLIDNQINNDNDDNDIQQRYSIFHNIKENEDKDDINLCKTEVKKKFQISNNNFLFAFKPENQLNAKAYDSSDDNHYIKERNIINDNYDNSLIEGSNYLEKNEIIVHEEKIREITQTFGLIQMKNDVSNFDDSDQEGSIIENIVDRNNIINEIYKENNYFSNHKNIIFGSHNEEINKENEDLSYDFKTDSFEKELINSNYEKSDSICFQEANTEESRKTIKLKEFIEKIASWFELKNRIIKHKSLIIMNLYEPDKDQIFTIKINRIFNNIIFQKKSDAFWSIFKSKKIKRNINFKNIINKYKFKFFMKSLKEISTSYKDNNKSIKFLNTFSRTFSIYKYNILIDAFMRIYYHSQLKNNNLNIIKDDNKKKDIYDKNVNYVFINEKKKKFENNESFENTKEKGNSKLEDKKEIKENLLEDFQSLKDSIKNMEENLKIKKDLPLEEYEVKSRINLDEESLKENSLYFKSFINREKEKMNKWNVKDNIGYIGKKKIEDFKSSSESVKEKIQIDLNGESNEEENYKNSDLKELISGLKNFLHNFKNRNIKKNSIKDEIDLLTTFVNQKTVQKEKNKKLKSLIIEIIKILKKMILKKKKFPKKLKRKNNYDFSDSSDQNEFYDEGIIDKILFILKKLSKLKKNKVKTNKSNLVKKNNLINLGIIVKIIIERKNKELKKTAFSNLKEKFKNEKAQEKIRYLAIKYKNELKKNNKEILRQKQYYKKPDINKYKVIKNKIPIEKIKEKEDNRLLKSVNFKSINENKETISNINFKSKNGNARNAMDDFLFLQLEEEYMGKVSKRNGQMTILN